MEYEASSYFGEGFDLCKKQLSLHFPDIDDMQIDPNLVDGDEDAKVNEDEIVQNAILPTTQNLYNVGL